MQTLLEHIDGWILFGFFAQFVFFLRFFIQWLYSEKAKKTVIPLAFWYLSILGSIMILIYSVKRNDIVFIAASILNSFMYIRNLVIIHRNKMNIPD